MRYRLNGRITVMDENEKLQEGDSLVQIMTGEEYDKFCGSTMQEHLFQRSMRNIRFSKAEILKNCVIGTILLPDKKDLLGPGVGFGYYMDPKRLIFVDNTGKVETIIRHIEKIQIVEKTYVAHFLFEFLDYLIRDDILFIQEYEEKLTDVEEGLMRGEIQHFDEKFLVYRKELQRINSYYMQMEELGDTLEECMKDIFTEMDEGLFSFFADRADRYYHASQGLRDYSIQIRDLYESKIAVKQNQIMQFLTIITTVFMPLTLIVGWYGMNFVNMPELTWKYGYLVIILISVTATVGELILFKVKKWI